MSFMVEIGAFLKGMSCLKRPFNISPCGLTSTVSTLDRLPPPLNSSVVRSSNHGGLFPEDHVCTFPFIPQAVDVIPVMCCCWCHRGSGRTKPKMDWTLVGGLVGPCSQSIKWSKVMCRWEKGCREANWSLCINSWWDLGKMMHSFHTQHKDSSHVLLAAGLGQLPHVPLGMGVALPRSQSSGQRDFSAVDYSGGDIVIQVCSLTEGCCSALLCAGTCHTMCRNIPFLFF